MRDRILEAIAENPPANLADGGTIRAGYHAELDELRDLSRNGRQYIAQIEARERTRTGIGSLKVRFNNVFGYYIEISKANLHLAPPDYERKQTLVNAERFTTPELKDYERKILDADEKILLLEKRSLRRCAAVRRRPRPAHPRDRRRRRRTRRDGRAGTGGRREPLLSPALLCGRRDAHRGGTASGDRTPGRHRSRPLHPQRPLSELRADLISLITGPNMGGKSTYLRQTALIAILAQMGSFVPADSALLPLIDRIFTRIGASDNLARGRSTFMVEMTETAVILNTATPRSLIVLDEIGRGTATYDGLALAWAVVEHIHARTRAKTLFATHYHELTELADQLEGVRNLQVSVKEAGDRIIFLRKVEPGRADRSYGIEVARLAGLPLRRRRARARSPGAARALRTRGDRRADPASQRTRADPALRAAGLRTRREASAASTSTSCGPSTRCGCWPTCRRN